MFWSEVDDGVGPSKIMRATLSGEKPTTVVSTMGTPAAISLDYKTEMWVLN